MTVRQAARALMVAGLLCLAGGAASAADAIDEKPQPDLVKLLPDHVATAQKLTIAVALGSPPDDFRDEHGDIVGWEVDILRGATQLLGLELELRPTTFDSLIPGLQARRFDGAVGQMGITTVREKVLDMVGTLLGNELFAARKDSALEVRTLQDLCGVAVSTTRGSREYEFAMAENPNCAAGGKKPIDIQVFNDGTSAADALMSRRVEAFWLGSTAIGYFVGHSNGQTKIIGSYTDRSYIGIGLPKGSDMATVLQAAIQHLIDDGTYARILAKWGLENGAIKTVPVNPTGTPS